MSHIHLSILYIYILWYIYIYREFVCDCQPVMIAQAEIDDILKLLYYYELFWQVIHK